MSENYKEDIQKLFSLILGSKVNTVEKRVDIGEKDLFVFCVQQLEECLKKEDQLEMVGINIDVITDPLWFVIENLCVAFYGHKVTDLVMWYLYERIDVDTQEIMAYIADDEKRYMFSSPEDLWAYVKYKFL